MAIKTPVKESRISRRKKSLSRIGNTNLFHGSAYPSVRCFPIVPLEHRIPQIQNRLRIEQQLAVIRNHQMLRRATLRQKLFAMKLCGRPVPAYPARCLKRLGKGISWRARGRAFRER